MLALSSSLAPALFGSAVVSRRRQYEIVDLIVNGWEDGAVYLTDSVLCAQLRTQKMTTTMMMMMW